MGKNLNQIARNINIAVKYNKDIDTAELLNR